MVDDQGSPLSAEFTVEPEGQNLAFILESRSGRKGRPNRNQDYLPALELVLSRLKDHWAVLQDALVDSRDTRDLPESERRLIKAPINLADVTDLHDLRLQLTRAQRTTGQREGVRGPGNNTKRIRLRLSVPDFAVSDAHRLAAALALPSGPPSRQSLPDEDPGASSPGDSPASPGQTIRHLQQTYGGRAGYLIDQVLKVALEQYAVKMVMDHYRDVEGYRVENVGKSRSYDVHATRGNEEVHIEVKGSSGTAEDIELTAGEVRHAHEFSTHLVIVDNIRWRPLADGEIELSGGRTRRWIDWVPAIEQLKATRYRYKPSTPSDHLAGPRPLP